MPRELFNPSLGKVRSYAVDEKTAHVGPLNSVTIGEDRIEWVKHSRLLGVTIDDRLSWSHHLTGVKKNFVNKLNLLKRSSFLSRNAVLDLYIKIILPSVLYGLVVCGPSTFSGSTSPLGSQNNIQLVPRYAY